MRFFRAGVAFMALSLGTVSCTAVTTETSTTSPTVPSTTTSTIPASEAAVSEFVACLGERGIQIDEIPLDANGRPRLEVLADEVDYTDPDQIEAISECAPILTRGALDLAFDDDYRERVVGQLQSFSRCLRARGVDEFPDPTPGFIGIGPPFPTAEIPYSDPDLPEAVVACERTVFGGDTNG